MKLKITSLIKPYLSSIDNGSMFRKPIGWLYVVLAAISSLIPFYLIYVAISLNTFYFRIESSNEKLKLVAPQFEKTRIVFDSLTMAANEFAQSIENEQYNYSEAVRLALEYRSYLNYGSYYVEYFEKANKEADVYSLNIKALQKDSQIVANKITTLKPKYERDLKQFNVLNDELQTTSDKYNRLSPSGAFHTPNNKVLSVIGLVLFCLFILLIGFVCALVLWNRSVELKNLNSDDDKFTAIPVVSHFVQTIGEYVATYIATMGFATILIAVAFKTCFGEFLLDELYFINLKQLSQQYELGIPYLLVPIVAAFFVLWTTKIIAEAIKTFVAIANNTGNGNNNNNLITRSNNNNLITSTL